MKKKKFYMYILIKLLLIVLMYGAGFYFYDKVPEQIATRWNFTGEANDYTPKDYALFIYPLFVLALIPFFMALRRIDPHFQRYKYFEVAWEFMQLGILGILTYMYFVMIAESINPVKVNVGAHLLGSVGVFLVFYGYFLRNVKQSYFVGFKTPWALEHRLVWDYTQKIAGVCFMIGGAVLLLDSLVYWQVGMVIASVIAFVLAVPFVASYYNYKKVVEDQ